MTEKQSNILNFDDVAQALKRRQTPQTLAPSRSCKRTQTDARDAQANGPAPEVPAISVADVPRNTSRRMRGASKISTKTASARRMKAIPRVSDPSKLKVDVSLPHPDIPSTPASCRQRTCVSAASELAAAQQDDLRAAQKSAKPNSALQSGFSGEAPIPQGQLAGNKVDLRSRTQAHLDASTEMVGVVSEQDERIKQAQEAARKSAERQKSWWGRLQRGIAARKADKGFQANYARDTRIAPIEGSDNRAALYKGEMGSSHRRAQRMQASGGTKARPSFSLGLPSINFGTLIQRRSFRAGVIVLAAILAVGVFLYPALKDYYISIRQYDRAQAELAAVSARNEAIEEKVKHLKTPEGTQDIAHEEFGWVGKGENAVYVHGLDAERKDKDFTAEVPAGSVPTPETWYSKFLDPVFGYNPQANMSN